MRVRRFLVPGGVMVVLSLAVLILAGPTGPTPVPLWPAAAPLAVGESDHDRPTLTPYLAANAPKNAPAVVVCPGGGYGALAMDHEGKQVAEYFNTLGVHAFVLKYRIVGKGRPGPLLKAPLLDAQRAVRTVRAGAEKHGIDPKKVGLMGFSAGGHLASTAGTHFDAGDKDAPDGIDRVSCRPDFLILAYPVITTAPGVTHGGSVKNLLGDKPDAKLLAEFSNEDHVSADTPPTFLFHTDEDKGVPPENAGRFYLALKKHKVPAEMHIYASGVHGIGLGNDPKWTKGNAYTESWPKHLAAWLTLRGVLSPARP